jgi:3-phosphoglycerate kinase
VPETIKNQWYKPPSSMQYHTFSLTAVLGGSVKNTQDILDKILIANALLDTAKNIHFYGEIGLAAIYALGINVGRVDRNGDNNKDYEQTKEFFIQLFRKAIDKEVKLYFPYEFIVSQKIEIEDTVKGEDSHNNT